MLNILFVNRKKKSTAYSIENVFYEIRKSLLNKCIINETTVSFKLFFTIKNIDVYHITGDIYYAALLTPRAKTVVTIHDIDHYEHTLKGLKKVLYGLLWLKIPLMYVKHITTVSNYTKNRLVKCFNINPQKIVVVYNPISSIFPRKVELLKNEIPCILQIGNGYNKNVEKLIEAATGINCKIIFINKLNQHLLDLLDERGINYEQHFNISYKNVVDLYIKSDIVFFASLYEGFGIPIIEAQAIGRPVITSNCSSMPEIAGNGACLVNPLSSNEIQVQILELLGNKNFYDTIMLNGFFNVERFEPNKIANQYFNLYLKIANE